MIDIRPERNVVKGNIGETIALEWYSNNSTRKIQKSSLQEDFSGVDFLDPADPNFKLDVKNYDYLLIMQRNPQKKVTIPRPVWFHSKSTHVFSVKESKEYTRKEYIGQCFLNNSDIEIDNICEMLTMNEGHYSDNDYLKLKDDMIKKISSYLKPEYEIKDYKIQEWDKIKISRRQNF